MGPGSFIEFTFIAFISGANVYKVLARKLSIHGESCLHVNRSMPLGRSGTVVNFGDIVENLQIAQMTLGEECFLGSE